ncbi:MAG TPA: DUF4440 domain-containing protein [Pyrinomonadaceae bacterium]|nr:DUF4440 domain-containing protein [Chloracidobacterium sp.]MBP9935098.1 DUF4440 domain-containing protein [Pyrinomonadaceae bacterium]MBK7803476.1 DUF4440 domain-containing protein [Chloracidobacterium sp.]MBK9438725.1 DUF4440 domain-containing protein [Chloracidobacterium sp.]MBK9766785.1 DUF4440 domain-containing protein [Chloracidobacterium sp.]
MRTATLSFLFLLIISATLFAQADKSATAIRKVMDDQAAAWNKGDLDAFMSIGYWRSDKLTFVSGTKITRGWQQTLDNYKKGYDSRSKMGVLTFSDLEITMLGKNAAVVLGNWSLAREKDNPNGKFTLTFRKFKEGWRIIMDHTS